MSKTPEFKGGIEPVFAHLHITVKMADELSGLWHVDNKVLDVAMELVITDVKIEAASGP